MKDGEHFDAVRTDVVLEPIALDDTLTHLLEAVPLHNPSQQRKLAQPLRGLGEPVNDADRVGSATALERFVDS
jgi:hypothetical protein